MTSLSLPHGAGAPLLSDWHHTTVAPAKHSGFAAYRNGVGRPGLTAPDVRENASHHRSAVQHPDVPTTVAGTHHEPHEPEASLPESIELTSIDRMARNNFVNLIWTFDSALDANILQSALPLALAKFPTFAGRISPGFDRLVLSGDLHIALQSATATRPIDAFFPACGRDGVRTAPVRDAATVGGAADAIFAHAPKHYTDLADGQRPLTTVVLVDVPLSGAFVVGVSFSHVVGDAQTMLGFVQEWARCSRALATASPGDGAVGLVLAFTPRVNDVFRMHCANVAPAPPVSYKTVKDSFFAKKPPPPPPAPDSTTTTPPPAPSSLASKVFLFTNAELARLKNDVHTRLHDRGHFPTTGLPPSTDDCLTALVWHLVARLPGRDRAAPATLYRPVNIRARLGLRPDVPGNIVLSHATPARPGAEPLEDLALKLRRTLASHPVDSELRFLLDRVAEPLFFASNVFAAGQPDLVLASWRCFDFEGAAAFPRAMREAGEGAEVAGAGVARAVFFNTEGWRNVQSVGQLIDVPGTGAAVNLALHPVEMAQLEPVVAEWRAGGL